MDVRGQPTIKSKFPKGRALLPGDTLLMSVRKYLQEARSMAYSTALNIGTRMETEAQDLSGAGSSRPKTSPSLLHRSTQGSPTLKRLGPQLSVWAGK